MFDEKMLMKYKVTELKQQLLELGITPKGLKADLVKQLCNALNQLEANKQQLAPQENNEFVQNVDYMQPQYQQPIVESQQEFGLIQNVVQSQQQITEAQQFQIGLEHSNEVVQQSPIEQQEILEESQQTNESVSQQSMESESQQTNESLSQQSLESESQQEILEESQQTNESEFQHSVESESQKTNDSESQPSINNESQDSLSSQQYYDDSQESIDQSQKLASYEAPSQIEMSNSVENSESSNDYQAQTNGNIEPEYAYNNESSSASIENADVSVTNNTQSSKTNDIVNNGNGPVVCDDEADNKGNVLLTEIKEEQVDDNDDVELLQNETLKALQVSEEEWSKMNKYQRRKLKKKFRNKIKRKERDEIERIRQKLILKNKEEMALLQQQELKVEDDDRMDIDEEDEPEEEKEKKRLLELQKQTKKKTLNVDDVEIEYVPEEMAKDSVYLQFLKVFDKFSAVSADEASRLEEERLADEISRNKDDRSKMLALKKPVELELKDDDEKDVNGMGKMSKRKKKQLTRMSVADLKQRVLHPELVEMHDVTSRDPVFLLHLKSTRNTVPVPRHWCYKRKYLQGKRGFEKPPFKLPEFIRRTGIQEMREAVQEKEDAKSLKNKMREKIRPKMGKIDIDYQKLHDAFFKWQTKPKMTIHGDLYYEGKELETKLKDKKPGDLSTELRSALGMPTGPNAHKCPPPWLIAMQRYGPPPSYPNLKIPGLNAPIPEGCCFGYHAGGWGKPPVDEYGRPLYGDVFGLTSASKEENLPEEEVDRTHWGEMEDNESDVEEEEEEDEDEESAAVVPENNDVSGLVTPAANQEGLVTPSGLSSGLPQGLVTPDMIELRKRKQQIEAEMEGDDQQLYTVIPEKKTDRFGKDMMGSIHVYDFASLSKTKSSSSSSGVEVTLDPSELEAGTLDSSAMEAKYEQTIRQSSNNNPHEDLSDMVAEYASRQKRKKDSSSGGNSSKSSKKYQFKF